MEKVLGVQTFPEDLDAETEFMTISSWESVQAIAAFTGGDPTRIHHLERDSELLCCLLMAIERGSVSIFRPDPSSAQRDARAVVHFPPRPSQLKALRAL
jgi:heme-degrading monooxygenase HmoA